MRAGMAPRPGLRLGTHQSQSLQHGHIGGLVDVCRKRFLDVKGVIILPGAVYVAIGRSRGLRSAEQRAVLAGWGTSAAAGLDRGIVGGRSGRGGARSEGRVILFCGLLLGEFPPPLGERVPLGARRRGILLLLGP